MTTIIKHEKEINATRLGTLQSYQIKISKQNTHTHVTHHSHAMTQEKKNIACKDHPQIYRSPFFGRTPQLWG